MSSDFKYLKRKKSERTIEVPLAHAIVATEAHLRAISIINDDEDVSIEFTPTMVRVNLSKHKGGATQKANV